MGFSLGRGTGSISNARDDHQDAAFMRGHSYRMGPPRAEVVDPPQDQGPTDPSFLKRASIDEDDGGGGGGTAWLYPDLPWGAPPAWRKVHHRGRHFLLLWDVITFLGCIYVSISVPFKLGFMDVAGELNNCPFYPETTPMRLIFSIFDVCTDIVFVTDLILVFHTAKWVISTEGKPHWVLVDDLKTLRWMYLKSNFILDFIGILPWQFFACFGTSPSAIRILDLIRLVKLLRLYRIKRVIRIMYVKFPRSVWLVASFELVITMSLVAHWMCCLWYRIGMGEFGGDPLLGWQYSEGIINDDIVSDVGHSSYTAWISSFYWAITTMSTIGYGDITASTPQERTVAVFMMVIGCVFFAWTTGTITSILTQKSHSQEVFKNKMEEIIQFLEARDIPQSMRTKVNAFYMTKFPTMRVFDEVRIMNDLPSGLRKEISAFLFEDVVDSKTGVPLFRLLDHEAKMDLCSRLVRSHWAEGVPVTSEGQEAKCLYIVRSGRVEITHKGEVLQIVEENEMFGENAVLGLSGTIRRTRSAMAITCCELCSLSLDDFTELVARHISLQWALHRMVDVHIRWLDDAIFHRKEIPSYKLRCVGWGKAFRKVSEQKKKEQEIRALSGTDTAFARKMLGGKNPGPAEQGTANVGFSLFNKSKNIAVNSTLLAASAIHGAISKKTDKHDVKVKKPIKTLVQLRFTAMFHKDVPIAQSNMAKGLKFVRVSWPGDPDVGVALQAESNPFTNVTSRRNGQVFFGMAHLDSNWARMPMLKLDLIELLENQETLSPSMRQRRQSITNFNVSEAKKGSNWSILATGSHPLADIIYSRSTVTGQEGKSFKLALYSTRGEGQITIETYSHVFRSLAPDSTWKRVLHHTRARAGAAYFQQKQRQIVVDMRQGFAGFLSEALDRRKEIALASKPYGKSAITEVIGGLVEDAKSLPVTRDDVAQIVRDEVKEAMSSLLGDLRTEFKSLIDYQATHPLARSDAAVSGEVVISDSVQRTPVAVSASVHKTPVALSESMHRTPIALADYVNKTPVIPSQPLVASSHPEGLRLADDDRGHDPSTLLERAPQEVKDAFWRGALNGEPQRPAHSGLLLSPPSNSPSPVKLQQGVRADGPMRSLSQLHFNDVADPGVELKAMGVPTTSPGFGGDGAWRELMELTGKLPPRGTSLDSRPSDVKHTTVSRISGLHEDPQMSALLNGVPRSTVRAEYSPEGVHSSAMPPLGRPRGLSPAHHDVSYDALNASIASSRGDHTSAQFSRLDIKADVDC
mmetsp:Transcript_13610/g.33385  ORF Transcript_13610/g.33385 Transcript_13610/m.33385 type:complete len:1256 (+) Transcript_13610:103-3870(+)